jgi:hypothetical protein
VRPSRIAACQVSAGRGEGRRRSPEGGSQCSHVPFDSYASYEHGTAIGVHNRRAREDQRLPAKSMVVGVLAGAAQKAYPFTALGDDGVLNDRVGDTPVVVLRDGQSAATAVYARTVGGRALEFEPTITDGKIRDRTTGTTWSALRGVAVDGPLAGKRLQPVPHIDVYWFAWADYYPETELFGRTGG